MRLEIQGQLLEALAVSNIKKYRSLYNFIDRFNLFEVATEVHNESNASL
jgi:hypothetical protein